jgi:hypothetical protein
MPRIAVIALLTLALALALPPLASAQTYVAEFSELVSFGISLDLIQGTGTALVSPAPAIVGGPSWIIEVRDATHTVATFAAWDSGRIESSSLGPIEGIFQWVTDGQDPHASFFIDVLHPANGRIRFILAAFKETPPPPPTPTLKVTMTAPHNGDTVSGTNWVVLWVDGASGTANVFSLSVDGKSVGTPQTTSSRGPVTLPWSTTAFANGTHTLTGSVRDAAGNVGSVSISVIVKN